MMETVLQDLELDVREIKYLIEILSREPDSMLHQVTIRRINQMQSHLNDLLLKVENLKTEDECVNAEPIIEENPVNITPEEPEVVVEIVREEEETIPEPKTEPRKQASDLRDLLTLNDRFLFSRELFDGDMKKMDDVLMQLSQMESPENVVVYLSTLLEADEENEVFQDFMELVRKYFN